MTDAAIEWWGKAGDQALRRSAFQEAISHLGKAIEMADRIEATGSRAAAGSIQKGQRISLQTSYARAVMWSRGFGSAETKSAFSRAQALAVDSDSPDERFNIHYGLWFVSLARGELAFARETSESFRHDAERYGRKTETAVAHRFLALTCLCQGDLAEAQAQCEEALRIYDPERDREAKFRFGLDTEVAALEYLAHIKWQLGELRPAQEFIEQAIERAVASGHVWNQLNAYYFKGLLEMIQGMAGAALQAYDTVLKLCGAHGSNLFLPFASMGADWAHARLGETEPALTSLQERLTKYIDQGNKVFMPLYRGLVAEIEAEARSAEQALSTIEAALVLAAQTGEHWTDSLLHRIRGEILLNREPANTAAAEEAFLTAIAIAQEQKARSFELRAALSLAKLYESTGRTTEAQAVLRPALEDFRPTPEFPEIAEAQVLLAALIKHDR